MRRNSSARAVCERTDLPIAGLLQELKQRGLLDHTLVIWNGEFGRLPIAELAPDKDERKAGILQKLIRPTNGVYRPERGNRPVPELA